MGTLPLGFTAGKTVGGTGREYVRTPARTLFAAHGTVGGEDRCCVRCGPCVMALCLPVFWDSGLVDGLRRSFGLERQWVAPRVGEDWNVCEDFDVVGVG